MPPPAQVKEVQAKQQRAKKGGGLLRACSHGASRRVSRAFQATMKAMDGRLPSAV